MKFDPAASCRFFTAEDACCLALQAYYAATPRIQPPPGEPWIQDGDPYATPADFADAFAGELMARLGLLALDRLGTFNVAVSQWDFLRLAHDIDPEKIAPLIAERETAWAETLRDFSGDQLHDLPPVENELHNANAART